MEGDINYAWYTLQALLAAGFTIGVVLAVIFGAIRLGWKFAPYIVLFAFLVWLFGG